MKANILSDHYVYKNICIYLYGTILVRKQNLLLENLFVDFSWVYHLEIQMSIVVAAL